MDQDLIFFLLLVIKTSTYVYSTKVFETKTKENRNNKERIRRFQSKVQHI